MHLDTKKLITNKLLATDTWKFWLDSICAMCAHSLRLFYWLSPRPKGERHSKGSQVRVSGWKNRRSVTLCKAQDALSLYEFMFVQWFCFLFEIILCCYSVKFHANLTDESEHFLSVLMIYLYAGGIPCRIAFLALRRTPNNSLLTTPNSIS